ncbi:MAG TPA: Wzz/FepE/Etk N-terminal domain-containing protein [Bacillota bacterium]|nr:Wzz/FepE/Etk N-terminal domain-containing protein [Bacillota bacterium]HQC48382.1 Wzz/FepE/Etk N-terminal domain-containing protein [Bacillota bacterium]
MNQEKDRDQTTEISLVDILLSLKNHIVLVILITVLFAGLFWAVNKFVIVPTYDSTVKFYIEAAMTDEDNPGVGLQAVNLAQRIANTYIELMKTNSFYNLLVEELGVDLSVTELRDMVSYKSVQDTEILEASVRTTDPDLSLIIASTIATVAPDAMNEIKSTATLTVIDQPLRAATQSTPHVMRNTALGLVLGLFLGSMLAIIIDMFNIKIRTEEDITKNFDITIIGVVPKIS